MTTMHSDGGAGARPGVGFVGIGRMGLPMARRVSAGGFDVLAFDTDPAALAAAGTAEIRTASALNELACESDLVLVVVPTDADVEAVCLADRGILESARPDTTVAICSSVLPETVRSVAAHARRRGIAVLDAALTNGVRAAEAGTMTVLAGGDVATLEKARGVLACFGRAIHHMGPVGAGQVAKTVNNVLLWAQLAAVQEVLGLGSRLGVAPSELRTALQDCSADSWVLRELPLIQPTWPEKDLEIALRLASALGFAMPLTECVAGRADELSAEAICSLLESASA